MQKEDKAEKYVLKGNEYYAKYDFDNAIKEYNKALKATPESHVALCNIGNSYLQMGDLDKAEDSFNKAVKIMPNYAMANCNLGEVYARQGKFKKALEQFQITFEINPDFALTYMHLGATLLAQGSLDDAALSYRIAIEKDSNNAGAYNNLGAIYGKQQKFGLAAEVLLQSIKINSNDTTTLVNIATAYGKLKQIEKSLTYYKKAYDINPDNTHIASGYYHQLRSACYWNEAGKVGANLSKLTKKEIKNGIRPGQEPFINAIYDDSPKNNYDIARLWSTNLNNLITDLKPFTYRKVSKKQKINIGYISGHFLDHPTGHLIANLFSKHDKKIFKVFAYSCGADDLSIYRNKIKSAANKFVDVSTNDFSEIAKIIFQDDIDIMIDLDGYTDNNRVVISALRPAPIVVTYLGFPGTTGASFVDYIITDKMVTPKSHAKYFSEKFALLPHSYQVNNDEQQISKIKLTRKKVGLPEKAFVYCCFNGSYKLEPVVFNAWIEILKATPNSVLWLLRNNPLVEKNIKAYAKSKGLNPKRVIFSNLVGRDKHLKRTSLADVALDTLVCNGHTTTSDALWANVPVITVKGKHFAGRVAASLLTSANAKECITDNVNEYKKLAIELAKDTKKLEKINKNIKKAIPSDPPFNTSLFATNLEKLYLEMYGIYADGKKPRQIEIK